MVLGCLALWTLIPAAWLVIARALASSRATGYVVALVGCPVTMIVWGRGLYRLGAVYERAMGREGRRPLLLEALLVVSALVALGAFLVWFFVFAGSPSATPWPDEMSGPGQ